MKILCKILKGPHEDLSGSFKIFLRFSSWQTCLVAFHTTQRIFNLLDVQVIIKKNSCNSQMNTLYQIAEALVSKWQLYSFLLPQKNKEQIR